MKRAFIAAVFATAVLAGTVQAQKGSAADSAGVRGAALDYIEGWYAGDAQRMERALHPELAKRNVLVDGAGRSRLTQMSALTLINQTRAGGGKDIPAAERRTDVKIVEIFNNAAIARVDAGGWIDYMHLIRWQGQWRIINVLWENLPR